MCACMSVFQQLTWSSVVCCVHEATFSVSGSALGVWQNSNPRDVRAPVRAPVRSSSHALRAPAQSRVHTLALRRSSQKELFFFSRRSFWKRRIFPPTVRLNIHKKTQIFYINSGGNAYVHEQGRGHTGWFGKPDTFGWEIYPNMFEKKKLSNILNGEFFFFFF